MTRTCNSRKLRSQFHLSKVKMKVFNGVSVTITNEKLKAFHPFSTVPNIWAMKAAALGQQFLGEDTFVLNFAFHYIPM